MSNEALVERLAEAIGLADHEWVHVDQAARAVLPVVAAEVEAAVSVVRAERDEALLILNGHASLTRDDAAHREEVYLKVLEKVVVRVEALHRPTRHATGTQAERAARCSTDGDLWPCQTAMALAGVGGGPEWVAATAILDESLAVRASVKEIRAALSDPTNDGGADAPEVDTGATPVEAANAAPPSSLESVIHEALDEAWSNERIFVDEDGEPSMLDLAVVASRAASAWLYDQSMGPIFARHPKSTRVVGTVEP